MATDSLSALLTLTSQDSPGVLKLNFIEVTIMIQSIENAFISALIYGWKTWALIAAAMVLSELGSILNFAARLMLGM